MLETTFTAANVNSLEIHKLAFIKSTDYFILIIVIIDTIRWMSWKSKRLREIDWLNGLSHRIKNEHSSVLTGLILLPLYRCYSNCQYWKCVQYWLVIKINIFVFQFSCGQIAVINVFTFHLHSPFDRSSSYRFFFFVVKPVGRSVNHPLHKFHPIFYFE